MAIRGSTWKNKSKKSGFGLSIGSYAKSEARNRHFVLTSVRTGRTRVYESPAAAIRDGWYIVSPGK